MFFDDAFFMQKAFEEAEKAFELGEIPVGAVIESGGIIIGKGHNLTQKLNDVTAHAEMQAITAASTFLGGKYLKNCTIYITLEPCSMCAGALYWSQIGRVVFATEDPQRGFRAFGGKLHPKTQISFGILNEKCENLLKSFFLQKR